MEALLALSMPSLLLLVGFAFLSGNSLTPEALLRSTTRLSWRILKWLWKDRRKKGGAGRVKRPRIRYRR